MSKTGNKLIPIPDGTTVQVDGNTIRVKGPLGEIERQVHPEIGVTVSEGRVIVKPKRESRFLSPFHGLTRAIINNMVEGVTQGFKKTLIIVGTGYRAKISGDNLELNLGYSAPVIYKLPPEIKIEVPDPKRIVIMGIDKELVGNVTATIRNLKKPEPYKGKGIKYENEVIRRKQGKRAVGVGA
jgi:large subunit ribosomal protein L6